SSRPAGCCVRAGMWASRPPAADPQRSPHRGMIEGTRRAVNMHDRRHYLTRLGILLILLASPLVAHAQPAGKVPQVGFLYSGSPAASQEVEAFRRGLRELGYIEGQNVAVEYRFARGEVGRLPELAAELVRLNPDVIIAPYTAPALAAKRATSTIPIVFAF